MPGGVGRIEIYMISACFNGRSGRPLDRDNARDHTTNKCCEVFHLLHVSITAPFARVNMQPIYFQTPEQ